MKETTYTENPELSDGLTVGSLIEILKSADPDALIVIGKNANECDEYLYTVTVSKHLVGFFSNPDDTEKEARQYELIEERR